MPHLSIHHRQQRLPNPRVQARRLAQQRHMPVHLALPRDMPVYQAAQRHIALRDNPNRRAPLRNHKTPRIPIPHQRRRIRHARINVNHRNIVAHQVRRVHNRPFHLTIRPCLYLTYHYIVNPITIIAQCLVSSLRILTRNLLTPYAPADMSDTPICPIQIRPAQRLNCD